MPKSNIDRILLNPTIDTDKLIRISKVLQVNFFEKFWSDTVIDEFGCTLQSIHIGMSIDMQLKTVGMTQKKLSELIGVHSSEIVRLIKKQSINSGRLTAISNALNHNFFLYFYGSYEQLSESPAAMAAYYKNRYEKLLFDYERVNRELLDCRTEMEKLRYKMIGVSRSSPEGVRSR